MLEILISSSVLILVVALLRLVLRDKISARLQYALWLLVLVRLLVPVSFFHSPVSVAEAAAPVTEISPRLHPKGWHTNSAMQIANTVMQIAAFRLSRGISSISFSMGAGSSGKSNHFFCRSYRKNQ